jgi:hypothetical protein
MHGEPSAPHPLVSTLRVYAYTKTNYVGSDLKAFARARAHFAKAEVVMQSKEAVKQ